MMGLFGFLGLVIAGIAGGSLLLPGSARPEAGEPADMDLDEEDGTGDQDSQIWDEDDGISGFSSDWVQSGTLSQGEDPAEPPSIAGQGLEGDEADDHLIGGAGDDQMNGRAGDDSLFGNAGADSLLGGYGDDLLAGDTGDDYLAGQEGDDRLEGGAGNDTLFGGNGHDRLFGGEGDDWLAGGMGDDLLVAGPGQDTLDGDAGDDTLIGAFFTEGESAGNFLNGGLGNDVLRIGAGDIATGGAGGDRFELSAELRGQPALIMDFSAAEDSLVVVHAAGTPVPQLALVAGGLPDETRLLVDGQPIARIFGNPGPELTAIRVIESPTG